MHYHVTQGDELRLRIHGAVKVSEGEFSQGEEASADSRVDGFTG